MLDVPYLTLLMQLLRLGQQTTKLLITTFSLLFYFVLNIRLNNIPENSSKPQCLVPKLSVALGSRFARLAFFKRNLRNLSSCLA